MNVDGREINMELDTRAPRSIISLNSFHKKMKRTALKRTDRQFSSYAGHWITCIGRMRLKPNLYVVSGDFDTLCHREGIEQFAWEINFTEWFQLSTNGTGMDLSSAARTTVGTISIEKPNLSGRHQKRLQQTLSKYGNIFRKTAGTYRRPPKKVHLRSQPTPKFARPCEIPFVRSMRKCH